LRRALHPHWHRLAALLLLSSTCRFAHAQNPAPLLPSGVAYDAAGNLYFADTNRQQVFESTLGGALVVVAGTGTQGFAGDGGAATAAQLNSPQGVAVGNDGTLYIADTGNQRIRAVDTAGMITTFAGNGAAGFGGDNGAAAAAIFDHPAGLAIDSTGALLVCDTDNHRIRRIASGTVTTVAGNGVQGFAGDGGAATAAELDTPAGIAVAASGAVYIADTHNQRIRMVSIGGTITTIAGTGIAGYAGDGASAKAAKLSNPRGLVATTAGGLLIADSNNQRIRSVDASGTITTVAGSGVQGTSTEGSSAAVFSLNTPRAVAISSFNAPVLADAGNSLVRELIANGDLYEPAGLVPTRKSMVSFTANPTAAYGQTVASVSVLGGAGTPQGVIELLDNGVSVAQTTLNGGVATFATASLAVGVHMLSAMYLGDGVNPAASSNSAVTTVTQAPSMTTEQVPQASYAGLPLTLTAKVSSSAAGPGMPTGTVTFAENGSPVAVASLVSGSASGVYLAPSAGTHQIVAAYAGDANFAASSSAAVTATVGAMPDFALTSVGSPTQTVQAGSIATYTFTVAAQPTPFTGAVSMGVSGLPGGATASFAPAQVVPGTGSAQVILSIQTPATLGKLHPPTSQRYPHAIWAVLFLPMLLLAAGRRNRMFRGATLLLALMLVNGCGDRTLSIQSEGGSTFALTVSGSGTSLAGTLLVHSMPVTLTVE
jgi:sugar lactone lactonase YvrE